MGSENTSLEAVVVAAVGLVVGVAYFFGAMLALLSNGGNGTLLLAGSVPVTTVVGTILMVAAGLVGTGYRSGRYVALLAFCAVAAFGRPSLASPEPIPVIQTAFALVAVLYLLARNPVPQGDRSNVDESTSATRVGSTIR